ncbi:jg10187 [Pararge aegeria aegeria]|uniref:Jg10187 protein n=1 Tax=Pararge aegeria aegeria TaxID=348720 RepID=A0A8S4S9M7_9NEOP|nr:jg10187 [Pararge aegeria aegeria]
MFGYLNCFYVHAAVVILIIETCISEPQTPYLALYSPGDTEYTDVLVRRAHDNLTLVCEVRGEPAPRVFVWNYVSDNDNDTDSGRPFATEPSGKTGSSRLERTDLQLSDSGHYICSAPPFSSTKYVLVQPRGPSYCARGAFWCGSRCVLPAYVCDGRRDCEHAEDERPPLCAPQPCARSDKLNCSSGRCIPEAACCRAGAPLCPQPTCCNEHPRYSTLEGTRPATPNKWITRAPHDAIGTSAGYVEVEYPPLFEDRHAPDEYGFIQSTIYTVTACALIFMIAVVLLVSALCKMHLKRVALRGYAAAHRDTAHHYAARYPPRYEAARLLEPGVSSSPVRNTLCASELPSPETPSTGASEALEPPPYTGGFGLARLSAIFCSRYRQEEDFFLFYAILLLYAYPGKKPRARPQVPTQCCDVELTAAGARAPHDDLFFAEPEPAPRDLDYMAAPVEFFRRRAARRNTIGTPA